MEDDGLLTTQEAAKFLRVSLSSLYTMRQEDSLPFVQLGRKVMFRKAALLDYIKDRQRVITPDTTDTLEIEDYE